MWPLSHGIELMLIFFFFGRNRRVRNLVIRTGWMEGPMGEERLNRRWKGKEKTALVL